MGTSITGYLNASEVADTDAARAQAAIGAGSTSGNRSFVFFAGFDATNNGRNNPGLANSQLPTNVANLVEQVASAANQDSSVKPNYYPGVGTGGQNGYLLDAGLVPTSAIRFAAASSNPGRRPRSSWRPSPTGATGPSAARSSWSPPTR